VTRAALAGALLAYASLTCSVADAQAAPRPPIRSGPGKPDRIEPLCLPRTAAQGTKCNA